MTTEQRIKCHAIIHTACLATAAVGAGFAQLPGSDNIPISAAQVAMVIGLGEVFGIRMSERAAKSTVLAGLGSTIGRGVSQALIGWIPVAGNIINAGTAGVITESLGWMVAEEMAKNPEKYAL